MYTSTFLRLALLTSIFSSTNTHGAISNLISSLGWSNTTNDVEILEQRKGTFRLHLGDLDKAGSIYTQRCREMGLRESKCIYLGEDLQAWLCFDDLDVCYDMVEQYPRKKGLRKLGRHRFGSGNGTFFYSRIGVRPEYVDNEKYYVFHYTLKKTKEKVDENEDEDEDEWISCVIQ